MFRKMTKEDLKMINKHTIIVCWYLRAERRVLYYKSPGKFLVKRFSETGEKLGSIVHNEKYIMENYEVLR